MDGTGCCLWMVDPYISNVKFEFVLAASHQSSKHICDPVLQNLIHWNLQQFLLLKSKTEKYEHSNAKSSLTCLEKARFQSFKLKKSMSISTEINRVVVQWNSIQGMKKMLDSGRYPMVHVYWSHVYLVGNVEIIC